MARDYPNQHRSVKSYPLDGRTTFTSIKTPRVLRMDSRGEKEKHKAAKKPKTTHPRLEMQSSRPHDQYAHLLHYVLNQSTVKPLGIEPRLETTWTEMTEVMQDLLAGTRRELRLQELPITTVEDLERPSTSMLAGASHKPGGENFQEDTRDEDKPRDYAPIFTLKGESLHIMENWEKF